MRVIVFLLFGLMSLNAFADSICGAKYITDQSSKWTGECVNGQANGIGLLSFVYIDKNGISISQETFGRFINGSWSGLHLYTADTKTQKFKFVKYYNNSIENIIGPVVVTGSDNMHLPLYQRTWSDVNAKSDANNNQPEISYEKALNDI